MFGKKLRLRKIIDKHQEYFTHVVSDSQDLENPLHIREYEIDDEKHRALDISFTKFEIVFYGFIRTEFNNNAAEHMIDIKQAILKYCAEYYNNPFFENLTFDMFNTHYGNVQYGNILRSKYGQTVKCHHVFSCSQGFFKGTHKWKIQYIEDNPELSYGAIGIVSNNKCLKNKQKVEENVKLLQWTNSKAFDKTYYYCQAGKSIYHYNNGKGSVLCKGIESWQKGDVVTVILDFYTKTVSFLKNGKCVHENVDINIEIGCKYYPVVAFYHFDDTYRVITN